MKTILHARKFHLTEPDQAAEYKRLREELSAIMPHCMTAFAEPLHHERMLIPLDGQEIELETKHLFDNQWNTAPTSTSEKGLRVFDWQDGVSPHSRHVHYMQWLDQTPEMREIRRNTVKCGYCGAQEPAAKGYVFCPHCLGSEYLKASDLFITRMLPIDVPLHTERQPLTEAERGHLLPLYREAQLHGNTERDKARIAKQRADIESKFKKETENAKREHDGLLWLMDRGIKLGNVIYYSHTGVFSFGWRQPVDAEILSELLDVISEFPFAYEIKTADGRKLEGYEER